MYEVDDRDRVVPLEGIPQSCTGAPVPFLMADERRLVLAYYIADDVGPFDRIPTRVRPIGGDKPVAIIRFEQRGHMFGPPNDEAFAGHPLASRGLQPYGAFQIEDSSWIRQLEAMNSVHPLHRPEKYWKLKHLVFSFHDSTLECSCERFDLRTTRGSIKDVVPEMIKLLQWKES
jgi:hypothetical protein